MSTLPQKPNNPKQPLHPWVQEVLWALDGNGVPGDAVAMTAYMKGHFPFLGLKRPLRDVLTKPLFQRETLPTRDALELICSELWELPEREYQMIALDLIRRHERRLVPDDAQWLATLICAKSWWDTVDFLATHGIGTLYQKYPDPLRPLIQEWISSPNMWLNRTAIIAQVLRKGDLDLALMTDAIVPHMDSREFFLRKAIGWALRAASATNPKWVQQFVDENRFALSGLSIREALRNLPSRQG